MLEDRNFTIYTDHKPLIHAFTQKHEKCSPCQIRNLDWIGQFSTDIRHISGSLNVVADSFLIKFQRLKCPRPSDYKEFAKAQLSDEKFQLLKSCTNSLKFQFLKVPGMDTELFCDVSTGRCRPFVPKQFRRRIFETLHNLFHPGVKTTVKLVGALAKLQEYTRCCVPCQRGKIQRHTFSLWPEAIHPMDIKAETVAFEFYANWIARFGFPERLTSDQGRQFESRLFREFARLLGVKVVHTTPFNPQANGSVERLHRQLNSVMRAHATERWTLLLLSILLGVLASVKEQLNCSVAEMVYGTSITLPGDFFSVNKTLSTNDFLASLQQWMSSLRPIPILQHCKETRNTTRKVFVHKDPNNCSVVFIRQDRLTKSLVPHYSGSRLVSRSSKHFTIQVGCRQQTVNIDILKPAFQLAEIQPFRVSISI
ncbi:hypothetical protein AVEN_269196-1 [Araneus ventricosus]|uniref:Integrase catalytic domain-containing protein n=1 Tax=Araneus ventricosus TaxID=182803 RepID=A0A4Y2I186_ARAVE|nr:hypothetical protein AVEN_269196-1 [Araneus ventricosus]